VAAGAGSRSSSSSSLRSCSAALPENCSGHAPARQPGQGGHRTARSTPDTSYCCRSNNRLACLLCGCVLHLADWRTSSKHRFRVTGTDGGTACCEWRGLQQFCRSECNARTACPEQSSGSGVALQIPPNARVSRSLRASLAGLEQRQLRSAATEGQPPASNLPWGSQVKPVHHFPTQSVDDLALHRSAELAQLGATTTSSTGVQAKFLTSWFSLHRDPAAVQITLGESCLSVRTNAGGGSRHSTHTRAARSPHIPSSTAPA